MYSGVLPRVAASPIDGVSLTFSVSCDYMQVTSAGDVVHSKLLVLTRAVGHEKLFDVYENTVPLLLDLVRA